MFVPGSGAFLDANPGRDHDGPECWLARGEVGGNVVRHGLEHAGREPFRDAGLVVVGDGFGDADKVGVGHDQEQPALRKETFELGPVDSGGFAKQFDVQRAGVGWLGGHGLVVMELRSSVRCYRCSSGSARHEPGNDPGLQIIGKR